MDVTHKVSFAPGLEPVSILIIPPSPIPPFFVPDSTQTALQALAPVGQPWSDDQSRAIAQAALDADTAWAAFSFTVVIPSPQQG